MKKLILIIACLALVLGIQAQRKLTRTVNMKEGELYFSYVPATLSLRLADTVSSHDSMFNCNVNLYTNLGSSLYYDITVIIAKLSGSGTARVFLQGKDHISDSWSTITSYSITGADTITFKQVTTYQTYNFYNIRISMPTGTLKVYPIYIDGYFKRVLGSSGSDPTLFFLRGDSNTTGNAATVNYVATHASKVDTGSRWTFLTRKPADSLYAKKTTTINGYALSSDITLTTQDITEAIVTPGNRTRAGIWYSDTFRISTDTILAGAAYHPLIRAYGTDTTIVVNWMSINYKYKTAAYTSSGTDSIFIRTKYNNAFIKVLNIDDSYLSAVSGVGFFPVAVDKKDQGASWSLYIPHIYTVGAGSLWFRIKYLLVVRKNY